MNGHKVFIRLIQVFVVVNILLLIINIIKFNASYVLSTERIKNITSILEAKDIMIDVPLPRVFTPKRQGTIIIPESTSEAKEELIKALIAERMDEVKVSSNTSGHYKKPTRVYTKGNLSLTFADNEIIYLDSAITLGQKGDLRKAEILANRFILKAGLTKTFNHSYVENTNESESIVLIYYPKFKGAPVFDSQIRFYISDQGIAKVIMHVGKVEALKGINAKRIIYPIDLVLFGIEDSLSVQRPVHITAITLGYCSLGTQGMDILEKEIIPVYKIEVDGLNETLLVNAYTNEAIK